MTFGSIKFKLNPMSFADTTSCLYSAVRRYVCTIYNVICDCFYVVLCVGSYIHCMSISFTYLLFIWKQLFVDKPFSVDNYLIKQWTCSCDRLQCYFQCCCWIVSMIKPHSPFKVLNDVVLNRNNFTYRLYMFAMSYSL